ncbi:hypothetical protein [Acidimangrovimonas pyrenivorans]|uniref:Cobalamin biosynthesis protein CbiX n=1 Tax=Acidimangrovimonas pyrenivorans TaxID=2030798 RepID=A0ABV7AEY3_9RHOB
MPIAAPEHSPDPADRRGPVLVIVGCGVEDAPEGAAALASGEDLLHVRFEDLDRAMIARIRPRLVLCPLFTLRFDVIDVLKRLDGLNWQGRVCALSRRLPNPAMVRAEIAAAVPGLPCDLVELPAAAP